MTEILQARIMDDFSMPILNTLEENGSKQDRSFLSWVASNRKFVSNHTFASYCFYQRMYEHFMGAPISIVEYFSGAGISAVVAENILRTVKHVCIDKNRIAIEQLLEVARVYTKITVKETSFEDWSECNRDTLFDIHDLDNPCFTAAQLRHYHLEFSRIFRTNPLVVKLTDIAGAKMGWNKKYFTKHFGKKFETYDEYLLLTSSRIYDLFGYSAKFIYTYDRTAMMCLMEGWHESEIIALPDEPRGFVIENGL